MNALTYAPPSLRDYGTVAELTGIGGGSSQTDIFINQTGNTIIVGGITIGHGQTVTGTGSIEGCVQPVGSDLCDIPTPGE